MANKNKAGAERDLQLAFALSSKFCDGSDYEGRTLRTFLEELLWRLCDEQENFSSKRPFGNGGWIEEVYQLLVAKGCVKGTLDEDGCLEDYDYDEADRFVKDMIKYLCREGART